MSMNEFTFQIDFPNAQGKLKAWIPDFGTKEIRERWRCAPQGVFGSFEGVLMWKGGAQLGLFNEGDLMWDAKKRYYVQIPGAQALGLLDIPTVGLLELAMGDGDRAWSLAHGDGTWIKVPKSSAPAVTPGPEWAGFDE